MARTVGRSSKTGQFASRATVARWPSKTTTERVGGSTKNTVTVARSSKTGQFVSPKQLKTNPSGTIVQKV